MNSGLLAQSQNPLIISNGLVAYWSFHDGSGLTAIDFSGNRNDGILSGSGGPTWVPGRVGGGLSFVSSSVALSHWVAFPTNHTLPIGTSPRTYATWVYTPTLSSYIFPIVYGNFGYTLRMVWMIMQDPAYVGVPGSQAFEIYGSTAWTGASSIDLNAWTHIAVTSPGAPGGNYNVVFYKNGAPIQGTYNVPYELNTSIGPEHYIMASGADADLTKARSYGTAILNELRVYNRVLTATEILQLYNAKGT